MSRTLNSFIAALASAAVTLAPLSPALAGNMGGGDMGHMPAPCPPPQHGSTLNINKNINIFKPILINKNININKNILINKNIIINKVNAFSSAEASAMASAAASSQSGSSSGANSGAAAAVIVYSGSYQIINYNNHGGGAIAVAVEHAHGACHMQEATVVKSIHAVCVSYEGREFPASHMLSDTWIDTSYEGEVARCIPGSHLKVIIGEVLQSDQGLAGTYQHGQVLMCAEHEALRHFKDGMVKCAPAIPVPDCTERTNLRRYGTGDFFFSFRAQVCVTESYTAESTQSSADVSGLVLDGGVGSGSNY